MLKINWSKAETGESYNRRILGRKADCTELSDALSNNINISLT